MLILIFVLTLAPIHSTQVVVAGENGTISASELPDRTLQRGEEFSITLSIAGNTGFAALPLRIFVPDGLELIRLELGHANLGGASFRTGPQDWVPEQYSLFGYFENPIVGPIHAFASWGRMSNFTVLNTDLVTLTFRVSATAENMTTDEINMAFATGVGADVPRAIIPGASVPLDITLTNGGNIGAVTIKSPLLPIHNGFTVPYIALTNDGRISFDLMNNTNQSRSVILIAARFDGEMLISAQEVERWEDIPPQGIIGMREFQHPDWGEGARFFLWEAGTMAPILK